MSAAVTAVRVCMCMFPRERRERERRGVGRSLTEVCTYTYIDLYICLSHTNQSIKSLPKFKGCKLKPYITLSILAVLITIITTMILV